MPRQKSGGFDQGKYVAGYIKENIKVIKLSLNKTKPEDQEIIDWIESQEEAASPYLKRLVKADMEARLTADT